MAPFYLVLCSTFISSVLSRIAVEKRQKIISILFLIITIFILVIFSGLRNGSIGDTSMYMHTYEMLSEKQTKVSLDRDPGFTIINLLLININSNPQFFVFSIALITTLLNIMIFYKYKSYFELEIFIYITSGYLTITMNGMRQSLAATLILMCTKYLIKGKFIKYLICILLISTIHASALILIPIYFIVRQEAWSKRVVIFIAVSLIGVILYQFLSPILFGILQSTQYGSYAEFDLGGSSFIRTVVNAVPVALAFLKRKDLKELWPQSNIFVNMSLISLIFVSFGMFNWIFNRFTIYFQLYNFILIPYLIKNCFKGKERRLMYFCVLVCYFIFFYREHVIGFNMNYVSEYLNLEKILYK